MSGPSGEADGRAETTEGPVYWKVPSFFDGLDSGELDHAVEQIARDHSDQFERDLRDLHSCVLRHNPLQLLSMLACYDLTAPLPDDGETPDEPDVQQPYGELLQAILLTIEPNEFRLEPVAPPDYEAIRELLPRLSTSYHLRRLADVLPSAPDRELHRRDVVESLRGDTQAVRNWGYPHQVVRIVRELFEPIDDAIEASLGLRVGNIIDMCLAHERAVEERIHTHRGALRETLNSTGVDAAIAAVAVATDGTEEAAAEWRDAIRKRGWTLEQTRSALVQYADQFLPRLFELTVEQALSHYPGPCDRAAISSLLDRWALAPGQLHGQDPEGFFLSNPVWQQPLVRLDRQTYLWPVFGLFYSFALELMEGLIAGDPALMERYRRIRSTFLEAEVQRLFREAFPDWEVYPSVVWDAADGTGSVERDLLVLCDSFAVVVEAKSRSMSDPARRGAPERAEAEAKRVIQKAATQASSLAQHLENADGQVALRTTEGDPLRIDASGIHFGLPLAITLDLFSPLTDNWARLRSAEVVLEDTPPVPVLSLPELEMAFELLEEPHEKLHYLLRRTELARAGCVDSGEAGLLGYYLQSGFCMGDLESVDARVATIGYERTLDPYFLSKQYGVERTKPRRQLSRWWEDILTCIAQRRMPRWAELACLLLDVPHQEQERLQEQVQTLLLDPPLLPPHGEAADQVLLISGPQHRRTAILAAAYREVNRADRNRRLNALAGALIAEHRVRSVLVIGLDVALGHYPYSIIGVFGEDANAGTR